MSIVTPSDAREQCREDPDVPDDVFQPFIDAAEASVAAYLNRAIFADAAAFTAAQDAVPAAIGSANAAYGLAVEGAVAIADPEQRQAVIDLAKARLDEAKIAGHRTIYGMVANGAVIGAIKLTIGHLYANREDVVVGSSTAAVQLPFGVAELLRPYRRTQMP